MQDWDDFISDDDDDVDEEEEARRIRNNKVKKALKGKGKERAEDNGRDHERLLCLFEVVDVLGVEVADGAEEGGVEVRVLDLIVGVDAAVCDRVAGVVAGRVRGAARGGEEDLVVLLDEAVRRIVARGLQMN